MNIHMMQDISRSSNDISSNGLEEIAENRKNRSFLPLLVECISVGVAILIVLNTLNIVEEFMEGKEVILTSIYKSPTNTLLPPAMLICNQSITNLKYLVKGETRVNTRVLII